MDKTAATPEEILRWLLGSATVGATARLGLAGINQEFGKRDPLKPETDLYDPSIDIPVKMSPGQYQKYLQLKGQAGGPAKVAMWDNSIAAATMVGGGALGWHVVNKLIERKRKKQLAQELQGVRDELTQLSMPQAPADQKVAAAWEFLEKAAEEHCARELITLKGSKEQPKKRKLPPEYEALLAKVRARDPAYRGPGLGADGVFRDQPRPKTAGSAAKSKLLGMIRDNPAMAIAAGGTAGLVGLGSLPGVREAINPIGSGVAGGVGSTLKTLAAPIGHGAAAVLGPVATLSLLYGLSKGYDQLSGQNPRKLELAAMRKRIREEESRATPYFELKPDVQEEPEAPRRSKKGPAAEAVGVRYQDVDAARDAAKG